MTIKQLDVCVLYGMVKLGQGVHVTWDEKKSIDYFKKAVVLGHRLSRIEVINYEKNKMLKF